MRFSTQRKAKNIPQPKYFRQLEFHVNDELGELETLLTDGFPLLSKNGRMGIISFHSLEDRLIKQRFKKLSRKGKY